MICWNMNGKKLLNGFGKIGSSKNKSGHLTTLIEI